MFACSRDIYNSVLGTPAHEMKREGEENGAASDAASVTFALQRWILVLFNCKPPNNVLLYSNWILLEC